MISLLRVLFVNNVDLVDFTYSSIGLSRWSFLEPSLGVVNACLPVTRPALEEIFGSSMCITVRKGGKHRSLQLRWLPSHVKAIASSMNWSPRQSQSLLDRGYSFVDLGANEREYVTLPEFSN